MISCSDNPIHFDIFGLSTLIRGLTWLERILQYEVDHYYYSNINKHNADSSQDDVRISIPHFETWVVTMWHFAQGSSLRFSGPGFNISWKECINLYRIYSKKNKHQKMTTIRFEIQEYPQVSLLEALQNKQTSLAN